MYRPSLSGHTGLGYPFFISVIFLLGYDLILIFIIAVVIIAILVIRINL